MGPNDYESSAELRAVERPDRGAVGPNDYDSTAELRAEQRPYSSADSREDRGAELPHVGPHDCAANLLAFLRPDRGAVGPNDSTAELLAF